MIEPYARFARTSRRRRLRAPQQGGHLFFEILKAALRRLGGRGWRNRRLAARGARGWWLGRDGWGLARGAGWPTKRGLQALRHFGQILISALGGRRWRWRRRWRRRCGGTLGRADRRL